MCRKKFMEEGTLTNIKKKKTNEKSFALYLFLPEKKIHKKQTLNQL